MDSPSACILVAEDDLVLRDQTVQALTPLGYKLIEASDGDEALRLASEYGRRIDLLITNVHMPKMEGHELARQIKGSRPDTCILIVSGSHERDFPPEAIYQSDVLVKPVSAHILIAKVKLLLETDPRNQHHSQSQHLSASR